MPWRVLTMDGGVTLLTTADLAFRPLVADDPNGPQIATLWGEPTGLVYAAVLESPERPGIYTLIRREGSPHG
jgi:hypothetical protein